MNHLFFLIEIAAIWINLVGLGLLARRFVGDYAVARVAAPVALCLLFFFCEHFHGFGGRLWLFPASSALSIWLIWKERTALKENLGVEMAFAAGFFFCLLWRFLFPDIGLFAETIPDYKFLREFLTGPTLPANDLWFPSLQSDFYYGFQHYAGALMGRWLWLTPGTTYHLAYCVVVGLMTCATGAAAARVGAFRTGRWLQMASLLIGGSGICAGLHVLLKYQPDLWESSRFLGLPRVTSDFTPIGLRLIDLIFSPGKPVIELPVDSFSYAIAIGEYHPPLAGFLLLALGILLIARIESGAVARERSICFGLLAATVPLVWISSAWVLPLQGLLVGCYLVQRLICGEKSHLLAACWGTVVALVLAYPFLSYFCHGSLAGASGIRLTVSDEHATPLGWLLVFWPVVGSLIFLQWHRENPPLRWFLTWFWILLLFGTEFFFADDYLGGQMNRANSTLKWWPWVYTGMLISVCAVNLGSPSRVARYGTSLLLALTCFYGLDLAHHLKDFDRERAGRLEGTDWYATTPFASEMISALSASPDGITIESGLKFENCETGLLALYAGKASLVGWPVHEILWRGNLMMLQNRMAEMQQFYAGEMSDQLQWLLRNKVRYVLWMERDNSDGNVRWQPITKAISSHYNWRQFYGDDAGGKIGYWERVGETSSAGMAGGEN